MSRNFQMIYSDDVLNEEDSEKVEKELKNYDFIIKDEIVKIEVIYNIDLNTATIAVTIHCPVVENNQIEQQKLNTFLDKHKNNFIRYYEDIKPY